MSGLRWVKSSFSDEGGNNCVEVAATADGIAIRESDTPAVMLTTDRGALLSLIRTVKSNATPLNGSGG
ncbi:DUF397 domain-containing protein [Streptomyces sp. CC224B]|uniref:DUF397 domain-containing protein n=1 Tax=Streptomyces sp. CC224B TaxID=3044571 RepID=UPI0024A96156|nr:DUF397 domain-containing protein [Streptomyces sp. CC224B]